MGTFWKKAQHVQRSWGWDSGTLSKDQCIWKGREAQVSLERSGLHETETGAGDWRL